MSLKTLLICCLLTAPFISCTREQEAGVPVITFNCDNNAATLKILQEEIPQFEEEHGIKVNLIPFAGQEKLYAMMAAGQPPDVFYTNSIMRDRLAAEGTLLDLRPFGKSDPFMAEMRSEAIEQGTSLDGGLYQLVNSTFTYGIYYNKAFFDEAGIAYPDSSWTWDDLVRIAKRLTIDRDGDGKIDRYAVYIPYYFVDAFERMNHAEFEKLGLIATAPNESVEAFRWYRDLVEEYKVMPNTIWVESMGMQSFQLLESGRVAMMMESLPNLGLYRYLTIPWDVAPIPRRAGKSPLYFRAGSGGFSATSSTKYPEAVWTFLKWWISKSRINFPNPYMKGVDFVSEWEKQVPYLKQTHFRDVWRVSEEYNGGDWRNFVRYSSWTYQIFEESLNPKYEQMLNGRLSIDAYLKAIPTTNARVLEELTKVVESPNIKPEFREKIGAELENLKEMVKK
jgi:ABC-type glycerol-3-phosphate transport system substrate-binding protein